MGLRKRVGWFADPTRRYATRYLFEDVWTSWVRDAGGVETFDALSHREESFLNAPEDGI